MLGQTENLKHQAPDKRSKNKLTITDHPGDRNIKKKVSYLPWSWKSNISHNIFNPIGLKTILPTTIAPYHGKLHKQRNTVGPTELKCHMGAVLIWEKLQIFSGGSKEVEAPLDTGPQEAAETGKPEIAKCQTTINDPTIM